jgi:hypothetical protein
MRTSKLRTAARKQRFAPSLGSNALATQFGYWPPRVFHDPIAYLLKRRVGRLNSRDIVSTDRVARTRDRAGPKVGGEHSAMQFKSTDRRPAREPGWRSAIPSDLPVGPSDLEELGRWLPKKEMELLIEICERAQCDSDLVRPALLLCLAYAQKVTRMLDQDPFQALPTKS